MRQTVGLTRTIVAVMGWILISLINLASDHSERASRADEEEQLKVTTMVFGAAK